MLDLSWVMWRFSFLMKSIYVQFEGMVYQQIVGISMARKCDPLIADLFLIFKEYFPSI